MFIPYPKTSACVATTYTIEEVYGSSKVFPCPKGYKFVDFRCSTEKEDWLATTGHIQHGPSSTPRLIVRKLSKPQKLLPSSKDSQMIDFTKPVQTRDGRKVRILATDRVGTYPVIGLITNPLRNTEELESWNKDGVCWSNQYDLIQTPPEPVTLYINVYKVGKNEFEIYAGHTTKELAERLAATTDDIYAKAVPFTFTKDS